MADREQIIKNTKAQLLAEDPLHKTKLGHNAQEDENAALAKIEKRKQILAGLEVEQFNETERSNYYI